MNPDEYRKMAQVEDAMWYYRALHANLIWAMVRHMPPGNKCVLDAGCGTGGLLRQMVNSCPSFELTGLDIEPLAIELASERSRGAHFTTGSITALPFDAASFDGVVSADVICQIAEPALGLREFYRCLRPGGIVVVNFPAYRWLYSYHDTAVGNLRRYHRQEIIDLMTEAGFSMLTSTYWNSLLFPLAIIQRKLISGKKTGSDVHLYPAPIEAVFSGIMSFELLMLRTGFRWPFGCAVLAVGQKPSYN